MLCRLDLGMPNAIMEAMKIMHHERFRGKCQRGLFVQQMQGFTLMELLIAGSVAVILGVAVVETLLITEKVSAQTRLMTNARVIVQRNIDSAMGATFTGTTTGVAGLCPLMLYQTSTTGTICDDDSGSQTENISVLLSGTSNTFVTGTLTRIVQPITLFPSDVVASGTPVVLQVTYQVDYDYGLRTYGKHSHFTYSETTLRSQDSQ